MNCAQRLNLGTCDRELAWSSINSSTESAYCDMSDSFASMNDCSSPIVPRRLDFSQRDDGETPPNASPVKKAALSPPYKKVRALRLFDSPATPKTILEKCSSTPTRAGPCSRLFSTVPSIFVQNCEGRKEETLAEPLACPSEDGILNRSISRMPTANINPFTPDGMLLNKKKRTLSKTSLFSPGTSQNTDDETEDEPSVITQPAKRLKESNISRYYKEFHEIGVLGKGQFGVVTHCLNRLDGCQYALKRSIRPVAGSTGERSALNEVYAHAVLGKHPHVVRYYSAWAEDGHMLIQNEYCSRGSLLTIIEKMPLNEDQLLVLLEHIANGLRYIHSMQLVHMDIKPANIFVSVETSLNAPTGETPVGSDSGVADSAHDSADDGFMDDSDDDCEDQESPKAHDADGKILTYKIGDLGHVTCTSSPQVEEGDCRYLPKEVLHEDFTSLTKADIFALGLTLFEAGGGGPLPKNGPEWHAIRDGELPDLTECSEKINKLLKRMVHPDAKCRPRASVLYRTAQKWRRNLNQNNNQNDTTASKEQLMKELALATQRNTMLTQKLADAKRCIDILSTEKLLQANHKTQKMKPDQISSSRRLRQTKSRTGNHTDNKDQSCTSVVDPLKAITDFRTNLDSRRLTRSSKCTSSKFSRSNSNINF